MSPDVLGCFPLFSGPFLLLSLPSSLTPKLLFCSVFALALSLSLHVVRAHRLCSGLSSLAVCRWREERPYLFLSLLVCLHTSVVLSSCCCLCCPTHAAARAFLSHVVMYEEGDCTHLSLLFTSLPISLFLGVSVLSVRAFVAVRCVGLGSVCVHLDVSV